MLSIVVGSIKSYLIYHMFQVCHVYAVCKEAAVPLVKMTSWINFGISAGYLLMAK